MLAGGCVDWPVRGAAPPPNGTHGAWRHACSYRLHMQGSRGPQGPAEACSGQAAGVQGAVCILEGLPGGWVGVEKHTANPVGGMAGH